MKFWNKLTVQFTLLVLFVIIITTTTSTLHHFYRGLHQLDERIESEVNQFLELMSIPAAQAACEIDRALATRMVESLVRSNYFDAAEIVTEFGESLARRTESAPGNPMEDQIGTLFRRYVGEEGIERELKIGENRGVGTLFVHLDAVRLYREYQDTHRRTMLFNIFWNLLIVSLLTVCFFFWFLKPLLNIHASMLTILREDIRDGEIPVPATHAGDELGELAKTGGSLIRRFRDLLRDSMETRDRLVRHLGEKEVLLQEIHHRVKNNLQIISSLLNLQRSDMDDEKTNRIFEEVETRITSMALVHEHLYESGNLSSIEARKYTEELVESLRGIYDTETRVLLELDLEESGLGLDTAIIYGLILNELVSNAYKYGRPEREQQRIAVSLEKRDGLIISRTKDNGPGLIDESVMMRSDTLGMQLVSALAEQLHGRIEYAYRDGAEFVFSFPEEGDLHAE
jgi:two-component sensor histidine kinase